MKNERFWQPLIETLLHYLGFRQTLAYLSTCKDYRCERKWLIEHHALVDYDNVDQFGSDMLIKHQSTVIDSLHFLWALPMLFGFSMRLPATLTYLTFGDRFNESLDHVTLPPLLTYLNFGRDFDQALDNVK